MMWWHPAVTLPEVTRSWALQSNFSKGDSEVWSRASSVLACYKLTQLTQLFSRDRVIILCISEICTPTTDHVRVTFHGAALSTPGKDDLSTCLQIQSMKVMKQDKTNHFRNSSTLNITSRSRRIIEASAWEQHGLINVDLTILKDSVICGFIKSVLHSKPSSVEEMHQLPWQPVENWPNLSICRG